MNVNINKCKEDKEAIKNISPVDSKFSYKKSPRQKWNEPDSRHFSNHIYKDIKTYQYVGILIKC